MVKSLTNYYMCDFESLNEVDDCRVWAWAFCSLKNINKIVIGDTIESFIAHISSYRNLKLFFHNLKFDNDFIINHLLHNGFSVVKEKRDLEPNTLTTTISMMGQFYAVEIMFENGSRVTIYDSLKKLPFRVKEIAKAFKMQLAKGTIDYDAFRPIGYNLTENEIEYIENDVKIVAEALIIQYEEGMEAMTVSKDCLNDYISTIGGESRFRNLFPILSKPLYDNLKLAYRGGWVYVKESIAGKVLGKGQTFDYNSMYPAVMDEELQPFGMPISFDGEYKPNKRYPLYIQHIRCEFELKEDHLPTIQMRKDIRFSSTEYLKDSGGFPAETIDLYLTNIDLALFKDHYDIYNIEYVDGWMFQAQTGMFSKYIAKHMFVKQNSKGAIKLLAKLKLNGLYGKFGSALDVTGKLPYLKEDGSTSYRKKSVVAEQGDNGKTIWIDKEELQDYQEGVYLPVAIFTTSYARNKIIRASQVVYDRFCYADTDSIHIQGIETPDSLKGHIHESKLGYLKRESYFVRSKFLRPKTYLEEETINYMYNDDGSILLDSYGDKVYEPAEIGKHNSTIINVKCAGLDDHAKPYVTFDNFYIGSHIVVPENAMKLRPKHVKGGIVLEKKEINIRTNIFSR